MFGAYDSYLYIHIHRDAPIVIKFGGSLESGIGNYQFFGLFSKFLRGFLIVKVFYVLGVMSNIDFLSTDSQPLQDFQGESRNVYRTDFRNGF